MADEINVDNVSGSSGNEYVPDKLDISDESIDFRTAQKMTLQDEPETDLAGMGDESEDFDDEIASESDDPDSDTDNEIEASEDADYEDGEPREAQEPEDAFKVEINGKEVSIPKSAEFPVKIDGKTENVSLADALSDYSGRTALARGHAQLGRDRKEVENIRTQLKETNERVAANVQALNDMEDPIEFCEYFAELTGGDADKILNDMVEKVQNFVAEYQQMTPREREQAQKLRRYERAEKQRAAEAKVAEQARSQTQQQEEIQRELEKEGLSIDDWQSTLSTMREKIEAGETLGYGFDDLQDLTAMDVVDYAVALNLENQVKDAATAVEKELGAKGGSIANDTEFLSKVAVALNKVQQLHGRQTPEEVVEMVKTAVSRDNSALTERLSRKVNKTASENATSRRANEEDDEEGFDTLDDLWNARRQGIY